jgi:hypothetical protein
VKAVVWEPAARAEYDAGLAASPSPADFQQAVNEALQDIASGRIVHAAIPQTPCRECILTRLPYSIVYAETADEIRIFAFVHARRRARYWKDRLRPD